MITAALYTFVLLWPFTLLLAVAAVYIGYHVRTAAAVWWLLGLTFAFNIAMGLLGDIFIRLAGYDREALGMILQGFPALILFMYLFFGVGQFLGRPK